MKAVIFAGGVGTRLWPLSRKKSPKQFEKIIEGKSTLQLTVNRLFPEFKPEDIFISTGEEYTSLVSKQLKSIPRQNIIGEPMRKDVGPAVALVFAVLAKRYDENEPVVILWSDHLVKQEKKFKKILQSAGEVVKKEKDKIIFIGQKARFPSDNLGWIEYSDRIKSDKGIDLFRFQGFKYRPDKKLAEKYFQDGKHCWNLGYFITTPKFLLSIFKRLAPKIYSLTQRIAQDVGTKNFKQTLSRYYEQMPALHFDNAVLEQLDPKDVYVVVEDIEWSDVGAWEALKEALQGKKTDNVINGRALLENSHDNLIYNYDEKKLIVGIDLDDVLIVNSEDVILVSKKSSVSKIKQLVESFKGTQHEELT